MSGIEPTFFFAGGVDNIVILIDGAYAGAVLVRGGRIDAPGPVEFASEQTPSVADMVGQPVGKTDYFSRTYDLFGAASVPPGTIGQWRNVFVHTHVGAPGCYALQFDSDNGSAVVVFSAGAGEMPGG